MKIYLGFDTSNYTTSVGAVNDRGEIILNSKQRLKVKIGERGLRQRDAVFQHTVSSDFISSSISSIYDKYPDAEISAIGYSLCPRDIPGSYMPCFTVGKSIAECMSAAMKVPLYPFSHQAGHVAAALISSDSTEFYGKEFIAFHVSGGTTDILKINGINNGTFSIKTIGETLDLNAGQVIDRIGVLMGLAFPAGAEMERLASKYSDKSERYRPSVKKFNCNLSGIENKAKEMYIECADKEKTSAYVIGAVGDTLCAISENIKKEFPNLPIIYAGGVMSCQILQSRLKKYSSRFATPELSSDNAVGTAYLAMRSSII